MTLYYVFYRYNFLIMIALTIVICDSLKMLQLPSSIVQCNFIVLKHNHLTYSHS